MPYVTKSDLEKEAGGPDKLVELTDDDQDGVADQAVLDDAIEEAGTLVDSYAQLRYATPFATPPARAKQLAAAEALYRLKRRRRAATEDDRLDHEERVRFLEQVSTGKVSLGVDPAPPKSTAVVPAVIQRSDDEDISRNSLRGFW